MRTLLLALAVSGVVLHPRAMAQDSSRAPGLTIQEREDAATGSPIRVGSMRVWEDRTVQRGRLLSLEVVVLPATGKNAQPDPVFILAGGPGQNAAGLAGMWSSHWMRADRDIVLVSQRGTGGDNRLWCDLTGSDDDLQGYLEPIFDEQVFRDCLARLAERYDLTQYSTANAVDDLDDVRAALGYDRINLYGGSYGTRAALEYVRRHPDQVRVAMLNGVAPVAFINPLYHASSAQAALDLIMDECEADPDCRGAFGDVHASFDAVMERLGRGPVSTTIVHPETGAATEIMLSRDAFAEALRVIMYYDRSQAPYLIDAAAHGDFSTFAQQAVAANRGLREMLAFGMLLCVTCAEDLDRITEAMIEQETAGTFLGDARVRGQAAVCAFWPRSALPADAADPVSANVPVLLLSGRYDPVTPPRWGAEAAGHLPHSLHVVGPGSHGQNGGCIERIMRDVLERGTVEGLDTSCVAGMRPAPFRLPEPTRR